MECKNPQTSDNESFKYHENSLSLETQKTKHKVDFFSEITRNIKNNLDIIMKEIRVIVINISVYVIQRCSQLIKKSARFLLTDMELDT